MAQDQTPPPPSPAANDTPVVTPRASDGLKVSDVQWRGLALVVRRADGSSPTYVVKTPVGDAAIATVTAAALAGKQMITVNADMAWPTDHGRRALRLHHRLEGRRALRSSQGETR
ncbi:MAG: hypothetical protein JWM89_1820 [Acidimicrobiales bacterium]|nr:hypothetical protein [Acidimicrobiales bacterium]